MADPSDLPARPGLTDGVRTLARLCRPARRPLLLATGLALVSTALELVPFVVLFLAARSLVEGTAEPGEFVLLAIAGALASAARFGTWGKALELSHVAAFEVGRDVRLDVARTLATLPLGWFTRRRSGTVQRVLTEDVTRLEGFLAHAVPELVSALAFWAVAAGWLLVVDAPLAAAALLPAPLAFAVLALALRDASSMVRRSTAASEELHGGAAEALRHPHVLRLFDRHGAISGPVGRAVDDSVDAEVGWSRRYATLGTLFRVLVSADFVVVLPFGVWALATGRTTESAFLLVLLLAAGIHQPLERAYRLGFSLSWYSYGGAVVEAMLTATALPEPAQPATLPRRSCHAVSFEDVTFAHEPGVPTLRGVSFQARPGTITALVGPSGGGKSTLVRLLARFWDVDGGAVRLDGVDVRDLAPADLLDRLALVFQDPFLFEDTVAGNLRVGRRGATDAELVAACRAARVHDTVAALPQGYATVVGGSGRTLSGGERQRLTIARALLRGAPVVVLDEATAMADPENEAALQAALLELVQDRTLIVVAHRLRTVVGADHLVVVDGGRVVQQGTHEALLADGGTYARLWADMVAAESVRYGQSAEPAPVCRDDPA